MSLAVFLAEMKMSGMSAKLVVLLHRPQSSNPSIQLIITVQAGSGPADPHASVEIRRRPLAAWETS